MTQLASFRPARALRHPLWLAALAVLVLNDHVLKGSAAPAWLTGKLSDVAGPIVAAALLAVLVRARSRRGWLLSHVAVAAGFAGINLSPALAGWVERVTAATPVPWAIAVDPTDLLGLVALPIGWRVLGRACERAADGGPLWRRLGQRVVVAAGAFACMATSAPCEDGCVPPPAAPQPGAIGVGNETFVERLIRVRRPLDTVVLDCPAVLADPSHALPRGLFSDAETWLVGPFDVLALAAAPGDCTAYLIETEGLAPRILAWDNRRFPNGTVPRTLDTADATVATLREDSGRLVLRHEVSFPLRAPEPPSTACEIPAPSVGVAWSTPPSRGQISAIVTAPDGCNQIELGSAPPFVLCVPHPLPFSPGDSIAVEHAVIGDTERESEVVIVASNEVSLEIGRGSFLPPGVSRLQGRQTCPVQTDSCGSSVLPATLQLEAGEPASGGAGTVFSLSGGELTAVRVQQMPARDLECAPAAVGLDYLEYTLLRPLN